MSLKDYEIGQKIGDGAYSMVFVVTRFVDKKVYALKKVRINGLKEKEKKNAVNEIRILASIQNKYVIGYKDAFYDQECESLCLIMEYADGGDLQQRIKSYQKMGKYMSEKFIWTLAVQITCGLKALHDLGIVHRDIKSANVFLTSDGQIKIGDMNVSKIAKGCLEHTQTGTPYYASPEVWKDLPYDHRSDLWSLGCVIYEAICLKPPFNGEDMKTLYKKVIKGEFPPLPRTFSKDLHTLVSGLLQVNPENRIGCEQILALPGSLRYITENSVTQTENLLLKTIHFTGSIKKIVENLPRPNFEDLRTWEEAQEVEKKPGKIHLGFPAMKKNRDKSVPIKRILRERERENSEKSLKNSKQYRNLVLKQNFGALKLPKVNSQIKSVARNMKGKEFTIVERVKSEKFSRNPTTNRSLVKL